MESKGGTTYTHLHPESEGEAEKGHRGPSVQFEFSVPHFSAFPGDGRPALQIHIPQIPGEAAPAPGHSRRPRPLPPAPRGCSEGSRASPWECPSGGSGSQSRVPLNLSPGGIPSGSGDTSALERRAQTGKPRSHHRVGTDRDATTSKPVTPPRRVIPELVIIDFEWEETGSGVVGQTRACELISLPVLPRFPVPCGAGELSSTPWDWQPGKAAPARRGGLAGRSKGREV